MRNRKTRSVLALIVWYSLIILFLFIPIFGIKKPPFRKDFATNVETTNPEVFFIGNSMLGSRIDLEVFEKYSNKKAVKVDSPGSNSATWYNIYNNLAKDSGSKHIIIFFRRDIFEKPAEGLDAERYVRLQTFEKSREPYADQMLANHSTVFQKMDQWFLSTVDYHHKRDVIENSLQKFSAGIVSSLPYKEFEGLLYERFGEQNLRYRKAPPVFLAAPNPIVNQSDDQSFLPRIISLTQKYEQKLTLVNVELDDTYNQGHKFNAYLSTLQNYVSQFEHVNLINMEEQQWIKKDWLQDGAHLAYRYKWVYTKNFVETLANST